MCRESSRLLFKGVLFFIGEIKGIAIDGETLQWNGAPACMQYFFKNVKQDLPSDGNH